MWLFQAPDAALNPKTVEAFDNYIRATEARLDKEVRDGPFLWVDGTPVRKAHARDGEVVVEPWTGKGDIEVPGGLIHDWAGAVFIPGATLAKTLAVAQDYNNHKNIFKPEVLDSKLLSRDGNHFKIYLQLMKKKVITVVLNTEHDVHYYPLDATRLYSRSYSTHIAETDGKDHGFLWRLNSYWRFQERDGGVYVECEAVSLTRGVPTGLGWLINPIVRNLPRESLANTLRSTRDAVRPGN